MEESTVVNATQVSDGGSQSAEGQKQESSQAVNAEKAEVATATTEKPVQNREDNALIAKVRREAETAARDKTIADMGMVWKDQPITTYEQYQRAQTEYAEEQRQKTLKDQGVDPEIVKKYIAEDPTVKKANEILQQTEQKQFEDKNRSEFLTWFKAEYNRDFDSSKDIVPDEVWTEAIKYEKSRGKEGKSLLDAFVAKVATKSLKEQVAELQKKLQAMETNTKNASSSPGSVAGNGDSPADFISKEMFEAKKSDQTWVIKNLSRISQSRSKWGG